MAISTRQLSMLTVGLLVHFSNQFSFQNCIGALYSNNETFGCFRRSEDDISKIVGDLPASAINITISVNPVSHIPTGSFQRFSKLETLNMGRNHLKFMDGLAFRNLHHLKTLKLFNNCISELNSSVFQDLDKLTFLTLEDNSLKDLPEGLFHNTSELKTLILRRNHLNNFSVVARSISFLHHLTYLDICYNFLTSLSNFNTVLPQSLTTLQKHIQRFNAEHNRITNLKSCYHADKLPITELTFCFNNILTVQSDAFAHTPNVTILKLNINIIAFLKPDALRGLTRLRTLRLDNNLLNVLFEGIFQDLSSLEILNLRNNHIPVIFKGLFQNLGELTTLDLGGNKITHFKPGGLDGLKVLTHLFLDGNNLKQIDSDQFTAFQNTLQVLDLKRNQIQFISETSKSPFVNLSSLSELKLDEQQPYGISKLPHGFFCGLHSLKSLYLSNNRIVCLAADVFDDLTGLQFLTLDNSCNGVLYWKIKYGYYVFRAWFSKQWRKLREDEENCEYDAFISYNFYDEHWVLEELLPNLEGNGSSFKLCLHHRDFEPGRNIVDNIVSAVYGSRKTVCVVSRNFLQSEWCSLEIQLASYRLFDEHRDVLLLVFLEHIPERELSSYHHMRKVMLRKTYLQWPGSECNDPTQAHLLFWKQLRRALGTGSRMEDEDDL
ncbi:hypothetical protein NHX12_001664 [Muraenolepis orangiensis]|uniref:TIR domain-containing protein n=1 Tax=Muraenolepis orangiensis TaxID=630683 RepID=A0A9Q0IHE7_9TELE|nr:hypothetical protein NHX12_001664 [Muraenolepis orangiensis]